MTDSQRLLAEYVANGSETAFRELVSRYVNLVYSASVRLVDGDVHLAQDVAQTVFVDLARKAGSLSSGVMLGGWLHRHTCFVAARIRRTERRRQIRERQAAQMNESNDHTESNLARVRPFLDEAINELGAEDRTAVLLRFFEQRDFRSIGQVLGTNEDAAQKRVSRALEKLELLMKRRGVACSVSLLGTVLAAEAVSAAPAALAISVSTTALASAAAGTGTTLTLLKLMTATKLQAGIAGVLLAAGVAVPLVMQQQANARLHAEDVILQQQADQLAGVKGENEHFSNILAEASLDRSQSNELQQLRAEAQTLREETAQIARLAEENRKLQSNLRERRTETKTDLQIREEAIAKMNYTKEWLVAFYMYADSHHDNFPTNFDLALPFRSQNSKNQSGITTNEFEIVFHGPLSRVKKPAETIVLRQIDSWKTSNGDEPKWARIYGFADGHVEVHSELENDFEAYEKERLMPPPETQ